MLVYGALAKVRMNFEKQLIKKFIEKYPVKYGRPLWNISQGPVKIGLRVQLIQIVKVDPVDQVLVTNVWNNFVSVVEARIICVYLLN